MLDFALVDPQGSRMIATVRQEGQIQATVECLLVGSSWFLVFMVKNISKNDFGGVFDNKTF